MISLPSSFGFIHDQYGAIVVAQVVGFFGPRLGCKPGIEIVVDGGEHSDLMLLL
jgi:hypothetical protein